MYCVAPWVSRGFRWGLLGIVAVTTFTILADAPADAKSRRKSSAQTTTSEPRYAAIVVDVNSGATLHSSNPDSRRYPASLTKVMTLYLLFERLEAGKIKLDTPLEVSAKAAAQPPSKLGLKKGSTIEVEDAIKALVTRSANDIAVVIAEALGGTEEGFAAMMTRKARALAMNRTTYKNASGLPDPGQVTTARDQALLGLAIQDRFPRYYRYFSTSSFQFRGKSIRNHNKLLGRVEGIDGIKTGYTRASGFNLVSSLKRGSRHLIGVVLGGRTGNWRDARMRELLEEYVVEASLKRTTPKVAERTEPVPLPPRIAAATPVAQQLPDAVPLPPQRSTAGAPRGEDLTTAAIPPAQPGSTDPIRPLLVKTVVVKANTMQSVALAPFKDSDFVAAAPRSRAIDPPPAARPAASPGHTAQPSTDVSTLVIASADPQSPPTPPAPIPVVDAAPVAKAKDAGPPSPAAAPEPPAPPVKITVAATPTPPPAAARHRGGWMIQVGAFPDESEAREQLTSVKDKAATLLRQADPFTEPVQKGDTTLYRARFAGLEKSQAQAACKTLIRSDIACMALRN